MPATEQIELFMTEGKHNKTYQVWLRQDTQGLWAVDFAYGRIGSKLKYDTKTLVSLPYHTAHQIYNDLVQSKLDKGYTKGKYKVQGVLEPKPQPKPQPATVAISMSVLEQPRGRKFREN